MSCPNKTEQSKPLNNVCCACVLVHVHVLSIGVSDSWWFHTSSFLSVIVNSLTLFWFNVQVLPTAAELDRNCRLLKRSQVQSFFAEPCKLTLNCPSQAQQNTCKQKTSQLTCAAICIIATMINCWCCSSFPCNWRLLFLELDLSMLLLLGRLQAQLLSSWNKHSSRKAAIESLLLKASSPTLKALFSLQIWNN